MLRNKNRAAQLLNFDGMEFGNKQASDIDYIMDWNGKMFIFAEVKHVKSEMTEGQCILFENLCDAIHAADKPAIGIVCRHYTNEHEEVTLETCIVDSFYYAGQWHDWWDHRLKFGDFVKTLVRLFKSRDFANGEILQGVK